MKQSWTVIPVVVFTALAVLTNCNHTELRNRPLYRTRVADDLLARARTPSGEPASKAHRLKFDATIGPRMTLHVAGVLTRAKRDTSSSPENVEFSASLDGRIIFRRNFGPDRQGRFDEMIDLHPFKSGESRLVFQIRPRLINGAKGRWKTLRLEVLRQIERHTDADGPNVLVILVDTFRADHAGLYGYTRRETTPNLDAFGKTALVFDHAISPAAWTLPSVASTMTGRYTTTLGAVDGKGLRLQDQTLAEVMLDAGITTAAFSTNPLIGPSHEFNQGFETFEHFPWARAEEVNRRFFRWLDDAKGLQWFVYLHFIDPHDPYEAPKPWQVFRDSEYNGAFLNDKALNQLARSVNYDNAAPFPVDSRDVEFLKACYDEEIRYWDAQFGALLTQLERHGLDDRTIVVVLSDHGEGFGDHGKFKHGQQVYEESVHVPLILSVPGSGLAGRHRETVETRELGGTLLKLVGIRRPRSLRGNLLKPKSEIGPPSTLYTRYTIRPDDATTRRGLFALFHGRWKYIRDVGRNTEELYDLEADPQERQNFSAENPDRLTYFRALLEAFRHDHPRPKHSGNGPTEETIKDLRALGYVD